MNRKTVLLSVLGLVVLALLAWANAKWPQWMGKPRYPGENRMLPAVSLWVFSLGLVIEYPFVRLLFGLGVIRAVWVDVLVNVVPPFLVLLFVYMTGLFLADLPGQSAVLFGPLLGLAMMVLPGPLVLTLLHCGTFNPILWATMCLLVVTANTGLQCMVIRSTLKTKTGKSGFCGLFAANLISLGVASTSFLWKNLALH